MNVHDQRASVEKSLRVHLPVSTLQSLYHILDFCLWRRKQIVHLRASADSAEGHVEIAAPGCKLAG